MSEGKQSRLSAVQRADVWRRWKAGESLHEIGRVYGKSHNCIRCVLLSRGGIAPAARQRSGIALTLAEREDISRGIASSSSIRTIGFLDVGNYRYRVLKPLADKLGIPKLNFQVLRRTMATQAQNMGSVKDIQAHLRHAKADTTANEYMQALPESVQGMVGSMYLMLEKGGEEKNDSGDLQQNPTKPRSKTTAKLLKGLVGTAGFEPTTSTV